MSYLTGEPAGKGGTIVYTKLPMIVVGSFVLVLGWLLTRAIIAGVGILPDPIVFVSTFSPVLSAAGIGTSVYLVGRARGNTSIWLPSVVSGILSLPLVVSDPWIIVALGMGVQAPVVIRLLLLVLPIIVGVFFAHPWLGERRLGLKLMLLAALLLAVYVLIYKLILPNGNLIAIQ